MKYLLVLFTLGCLMASLLLLPRPAQADGVTKIVFIINASRKDSKDFTNEPSKNDLANIFLKKNTTWKDGKEFSVIQQSGNTEYEIFRTKILDKTEDQLAKHWSDKDADDGTQPPKDVKTNEDVYKWVKRKKDAIGFVSSSYLNDTLTEEERKLVHVIYTVAK